MTKISIILTLLATTLASRVTQAQTQVGGHIGLALPLVTTVAGRTVNDLADQFSIGMPVGITVKGSGWTAFDLELAPAVNTARPRENSLTVQPGLIWSLGHGFGAGVRAAIEVNTASWGYTPLVNHSWPIRSERGLFKAYFVEADLPVRFNRPSGGPMTNPVTLGMHFGLAF
jgi:hypothetical protein